MRGKAVSGQSPPTRYRITPAYAGKSGRGSTSCFLYRDHPRLCGEKLERIRLYKPDSGSPPPMRGKVYAAVSMPDTVGITPAYAGKSQHGERDSGKSEDHPRLCGEKHISNIFLVPSRGSPPPMRGKEYLRYSCRNRSRITPAYAGKRSGDCFWFCCIWDHPRLCGEKVCRKWI